MLANAVTHTDVERILNDRDNILVLHRLDGDIWGASIAATDIFGYSNEEMRQMCLVNIRPKALRLSDLCKDKMGDDAFVVFQKRNSRRFSASVKRSVISFVHQREPIELVCLQLTLSDAQDSSRPKAPAVDINELALFVDSLKSESRTCLRNLSRDIEALVGAGLSGEQQKIADRMRSDYEQLSHINENIVDSFQLAQNALSIDSEPFNIIEFLSSDIPRIDTSINRAQDMILAPRLPELIYGDRNMIGKIFRNLIDQVAQLISPQRSLLSADYESSAERGGRLLVKYVLEGCKSRSASADDGDVCSVFLNAMPIVFSRHVLRLMEGILRIDDLGNQKMEVNLELVLPEVHDLGLARRVDFLKGKAVVLVDQPYSPLVLQLKAWGAQVDHFHSSAKALEFMASGKRRPALFIVRSDAEGSAPITASHLEASRLGALPVILIGAQDISGESKLAAVTLPLTASVPEIGNVLSQALLEGFPYPYCNMSAKRQHAETSEKPQLLVVSHDVSLRARLGDLLRQMNVSIDDAVNGIDAVMASTKLRYDCIIIDDDIPYMDGVEAAIHLRRVSHVNKDTPVLIVTGDDSENGKLTRSQAGISADIMKPVNPTQARQMIQSLLMRGRESGERRALEDTASPISVLRRSEEQQEVPAYLTNSNVIDEQVLDRLAQDTSLDICKEMIDMFIRESLVSLGEISKCCIAGDWDAILEHAHSLRSSCRTFGCEALFSTTLRLEEESRKNNMGECMRLAARLPTLFLKSQQHLYDYCNFYHRR